MILSYHPIIVGDENRLCAGRAPDSEDLRRIRAADVVILPQGCSRELYQMARQHCRHIFPNYDARFQYPGKLGQLALFQACGVRHPQSRAFPNIGAIGSRDELVADVSFPLVFKFDWGGEGETVWLIETAQALQERLEEAERLERSGHRGFLLQEYIPCGGRSLRVVMMGRRSFTYWRIHRAGNFHSAVRTGATIEAEVDPAIRSQALDAVQTLCRFGHIDLAAFDLLFEPSAATVAPYLLEINYFFGRTGLGGSEAYYRLLQETVNVWLRDLHRCAPAGSRLCPEQNGRQES